MRAQIDRIDADIQNLIAERARCAHRVGEVKGLTEKSEFYRPEREAQVLRGVVERNKGPLSDEEMVRLFRELMSACLAQEEPLRIAYLGPEGTFTHLACTRRFGVSAHTVPVATIGDVFAEVEKGNVEYGVVPIENSSEGVVSHTLDMFVESDLKICGEILLEVSHSLLSKSGDLRKVKRIYSHPHAFAQSRRWLGVNLPRVPLYEAPSTAAAAELAAKEPAAAAIASELAASLYKLKVISRKIEDSPHNFTRFLIIGQKTPPPTDRYKTSLMFSIKDRVGALHRILEPFAKHQINLTKI